MPPAESGNSRDLVPLDNCRGQHKDRRLRLGTMYHNFKHIITWNLHSHHRGKSRESWTYFNCRCNTSQAKLRDTETELTAHWQQATNVIRAHSWGPTQSGLGAFLLLTLSDCENQNTLVSPRLPVTIQVPTSVYASNIRIAQLACLPQSCMGWVIKRQIDEHSENSCLIAASMPSVSQAYNKWLTRCTGTSQTEFTKNY